VRSLPITATLAAVRKTTSPAPSVIAASRPLFMRAVPRTMPQNLMPFAGGNRTAQRPPA